MAQVPAARITDDHVCTAATPQPPPPVEKKCCCEAKPVTPAPLPHLGGKVLTGSANVNIEGLKAARTGDSVACTGVPTADSIVTGAAKIFINGQLAAMTGSLGTHVGPAGNGVVTGKATKTFYGSAMAGAKFGNGAAATQACLDAAKSGRNGNPAQSKNMNCGMESVRQLCQQKCTQTKDPKACACANMSEDAFYRKYLTDEKNNHNAIISKQTRIPQDQLQAEYDRIYKANDDAWKSHVTADNYCGLTAHAGTQGNTSQASTKQWQNFQGKTVWFFYKQYSQDNYSSMTIEKLPGPPISGNVDQQDTAGNVPSYTDTRADLMSECGVSSGTGDNSEGGIAGDLSHGNTVLAVVDVGVLHGQGPGGSHTVTVTEMQYDAQGNLIAVLLNDTSVGGGCGFPVKPPSNFQNALQDGQRTNTVP